MFFFHKQITRDKDSFGNSEHCVYLWKALSIWTLRGIILPVGILTEFFLFGGIVLALTHGNGAFLVLRQFMVCEGQCLRSVLHGAPAGTSAMFFQRYVKTKSIDFSSDLARYYYSLALIKSFYFISSLGVVKSVLFYRLLGGQLTVVLNE